MNKVKVSNTKSKESEKGANIMSFITYENRHNPHVAIHRDSCNQIAKRGGEHSDGQVHYENHETYIKARKYAESKGLPVLDCSFCNPNI
jgi:hypothetical protein